MNSSERRNGKKVDVGTSRKKREKAGGVCRMDGGDLGLSEVSKESNFLAVLYSRLQRSQVSMTYAHGFSGGNG